MIVQIVTSLVTAALVAKILTRRSATSTGQGADAVVSATSREPPSSNG